MTDKESRRRLSDGGTRRKLETEGRIPALGHPRPPPPHPPIPGMMSAFIDFVKSFSMLLPMCLQDSKSRSIRGAKERGETSKMRRGKAALTQPTTTSQLHTSPPALHATRARTHGSESSKISILRFTA